MNSSIFLIFVLKKLVQVQYFTLELQRVCTHMEKSSPVTIKALNYVCMHLKFSPLLIKVQNIIPSLFLLCTGHVSLISPQHKAALSLFLSLHQAQHWKCDLQQLSSEIPSNENLRDYYCRITRLTHTRTFLKCHGQLASPSLLAVKDRDIATTKLILVANLNGKGWKFPFLNTAERTVFPKT